MVETVSVESVQLGLQDEGAAGCFSRRRECGVVKVAPQHDPAWTTDYFAAPHFGTAADYEHVPRCADCGPASADVTPPRTVVEVLREAAAKFGAHTALAVERPCPTGAACLPWAEWKTWTFTEMLSDAEAVAKACRSVGMSDHQAVSIFGFNSPEWAIAFWAGILAGGKANGIYPTDTPAQVGYKLAHSNSAVVFVEDESKLGKIAAAVKSGDVNMDCLEAVVIWGTASAGSLERGADSEKGDVPVFSFDEFVALGRAIDELPSSSKPGHCAALVYTSGTTGNPKAVMLSHDGINYMTTTLAREILPRMTVKEQRVLSYLPLSHIAGMAADLILPTFATASGFPTTVYFARPTDLKDGTLAERLRFVRPTVFLGVPRVYEKVMEKMLAVGASIKGLKKKVATFAKSRSKQAILNQQVGGSGVTPFLTRPLQKSLLGKARAAIGLDACEFCVTGAAPMPKHVQEYFASIGLKILEVYGMSETTGITTINLPECFAFGSCGYAFPGVEVKVFHVDEQNISAKEEAPRAKDIFHPSEQEQGEICFRGRAIMMGYLSNPLMGDEEEIAQKCRDCFDQDGWLHSGDKGTLGANGMFRITGRYKELIIGAAGENIAPVPIEDEVKKLLPCVSNCVMIGDKRKFNTMLITLKTEGASGELPGTDELTGPAKTVSPGVTTVAQAQACPVFRKTIEDAIKATNSNPSVCQNNAWKVQNFSILPRDFSILTGELTATLKLKRAVVNEMWEETIDQMYA